MKSLLILTELNPLRRAFSNKEHDSLVSFPIIIFFIFFFELAREIANLKKNVE